MRTTRTRAIVQQDSSISWECKEQNDGEFEEGDDVAFRCADVNECRTIPGICGNGGRCLNTYGSYSCFCKAGFYGEKCATFDPCRSVSCSNGGTCMSSETFPYWQCRCSDLYTGMNVLPSRRSPYLRTAPFRFSLRTIRVSLRIQPMSNRHLSESSSG